jgi:hypothetical protein
MLTDQALRGYEKYVISERNLGEALNILPTNSEDYLFLKLIHLLHETGVAPLSSDKEAKDSLKMLKDHYYSDRSRMVVLREILLTYDAATEQKDKDAALARLRDYCSWDHTHNKPTNLKKIKKSSEEVKAGAEDTSEEEDPELRAYSTTFDAKAEFSRAVLVDNFIGNNTVDSIHPVRK